MGQAGPRVDKVGVGGFGTVVGRQKGAAAVAFYYKKVSLLFITSHLSRESRFPTWHLCQMYFLFLLVKNMPFCVSERKPLGFFTSLQIIWLRYVNEGFQMLTDVHVIQCSSWMQHGGAQCPVYPDLPNHLCQTSSQLFLHPNVSRCWWALLQAESGLQFCGEDRCSNMAGWLELPCGIAPQLSGLLNQSQPWKGKIVSQSLWLEEILVYRYQNIQYASHWGFPMGECYVAGVVGKGPAF